MGNHRPTIELLELELELIVRDFVTILNEGDENEIHAFLTENVEYRPSTRQRVDGRAAVVAMICDIRSTFIEWRTELVDVATSGPVVLAELALHLTLPGMKVQRVMSFASFRIEESRISVWRQLHA